MKEIKIWKCNGCPIRHSRSAVSDVCGLTQRPVPHHSAPLRGREDETPFPPWCPLPVKLILDDYEPGEGK